jgi:UDP-hydrolysing UDP-N-acetyl-D-glucosamine 2-epimerase
MTERLEVVVTARPSWARVKSLVSEFGKMSPSASTSLSLVGPALSQRYGDIRSQAPNSIVVNSFPSLQESDDFAGVSLSCFDGASAISRHWSTSRPDAVLVVADRTETLGVAAAAAIMQIPLIHLQGGEISGSIDDKIRDANSKLADFHLTTNQVTEKRLIALGEAKSRIVAVGCPSIDLVAELLRSELNVSVLEMVNNTGVGGKIHFEGAYGMVMFHPDTRNDDLNIRWVQSIIEMIRCSGKQWVWFWPNPDHGTGHISKLIRKGREDGTLKNVRFVINLVPEVFITLALGADVLIGNSSFGIREASFIGLPVINLGGRQHGRQRAENVKDISHPIVQEEFNLLCEPGKVRFEPSHLYGDGMAGLRAARAIIDWDPSLKSRND